MAGCSFMTKDYNTNLLSSANNAGYLKIADAMLLQGTFQVPAVREPHPAIHHMHSVLRNLIARFYRR